MNHEIYLWDKFKMCHHKMHPITLRVLFIGTPPKGTFEYYRWLKWSKIFQSNTTYYCAIQNNKQRKQLSESKEGTTKRNQRIASRDKLNKLENKRIRQRENVRQFRARKAQESHTHTQKNFKHRMEKNRALKAFKSDLFQITCIVRF